MIMNLTMRGPLPRPPRTGEGYERLVLVPVEKAQPRPYTVRLHFAELEDAQIGDRVFDVKLQGRVALEGFDVVMAAGGRYSPVVKEFNGVLMSKGILLELVPKAQQRTELSVPIISGIEVLTPVDADG
jgi:hypothetical protein